MPEDLCKKCDVFIGFGGVGVAKMPEGLTLEELRNCCWICKRTRQEIEDAGQLRQV